MMTMMMIRLRRIFWVFVLSASALTAAHAGIFDDDEARKAILDLRAKVEANRQALESKSKAQDEAANQLREDIAQLRRSIIDLNNQNEQLKAEVARLRGLTEQQANALNTLTNDVTALQRSQKSQSQAIDDRMRQLEPMQVVIDGRPVMMDAVEKKSFDAAFAAFKANDFTQAIAGFNDFTGRYPRSAYSGQAYYWMGNAHYALRDCKAASDAFSKLVARYPDDARSPEGLLSVGNCQVEMGDKKAARRSYEQLVKSYANSQEASVAKERLAKLK